MSQDLAAAWSSAERSAWRVPPRMLPSQWAERYRFLARNQSERHGPWSNTNAPYGVGMMNVCTRPGVEEVSIQKAAQIGASEFIRNAIGYFAHCDPDPVLFIMPDEKSGKKIVRKRILPLFRNTPVLSELLSDAKRDLSLYGVRLLNGFEMSLGWSGSPATLASDPIRRVVNDEVDKFTPWSGRESDPVSLARVRTQTYGSRRLIINNSTPTTRDGLIAKLVDEADIDLLYLVPCVHCGRFQVLSFDHLRWNHFDGAKLDHKTLAKRIEDERAAWYVCRHCNQEIHDHHKPAMVRQGAWAPESEAGDLTLEKLRAAGHVPGDVIPWLPPMRHVAMRINCLPCLWIRFADVAAEWLRSQNDVAKLMHFRNSWLGEIFEQQIDRADASIFSIKSRPRENAPPRVVGVLPRWTAKVLSFADVQHDHFIWVIRAWAHGFRSQRIAHGRAETYDQLRALCLDTPLPFEGQKFPPLQPELLGIDIGGTRREGEAISRVEQTKQFALTDPERIVPTKGESEPIKGLPLRVTRANYDATLLKDGNTAILPQLKLWLFDSNHFKDLLAVHVRSRMQSIDLVTGEIAEVETWALNDLDDPEYNRQMSSEHKIMVRRGRKPPEERWQQITAGAANHYWDAEVGQLVLASIARVDLLPPSQYLDEQRIHMLQHAKAGPGRGFTMSDGRPYLITER